MLLEQKVGLAFGSCCGCIELIVSRCLLRVLKLFALFMRLPTYIDYDTDSIWLKGSYSVGVLRVGEMHD